MASNSMDQTQEPDMRADVRARLSQIDALCHELSMTLESEPDVVHSFLSMQAQGIRKAAEEWAASKARRIGR